MSGGTVDNSVVADNHVIDLSCINDPCIAANATGSAVKTGGVDLDVGHETFDHVATVAVHGD